MAREATFALDHAVPATPPREVSAMSCRRDSAMDSVAGQRTRSLRDALSLGNWLPCPHSGQASKAPPKSSDPPSGKGLSILSDSMYAMPITTQPTSSRFVAHVGLLCELVRVCEVVRATLDLKPPLHRKQACRAKRRADSMTSGWLRANQRGIANGSPPLMALLPATAPGAVPLGSLSAAMRSA